MNTMINFCEDHAMLMSAPQVIEPITTYIDGETYEGTLTVWGAPTLSYSVRFEDHIETDDGHYTDLPTIRTHAQHYFRKLVWQALNSRLPPYYNLLNTAA